MNDLIKSFDAPSRKIQLICFPFAGGYSGAFRPLHALLRNDCRMLVAEPPGHGTNRAPLVDDLEKLVELYSDALQPELHMPFVLFGHSMGGTVAYRLAQKLERQGIFPDAVIISAVQPPHIHRNNVAHLDDEALLDYLIGIGGIPAEIARERQAIEFFLPSFRADLKALETFRLTDRYRLQSPVHIFNGDQDEKCMKHASGWLELAQRPRFHTFRGGHMFLLSETEQVARTIRFIWSLQTVRKEVARA